MNNAHNNLIIAFNFSDSQSSVSQETVSKVLSTVAIPSIQSLLSSSSSQSATSKPFFAQSKPAVIHQSSRNDENGGNIPKKMEFSFASPAIKRPESNQNGLNKSISRPSFRYSESVTHQRNSSTPSSGFISDSSISPSPSFSDSYWDMNDSAFTPTSSHNLPPKFTSSTPLRRKEPRSLSNSFANVASTPVHRIRPRSFNFSFANAATNDTFDVGNSSPVRKAAKTAKPSGEIFIERERLPNVNRLASTRLQKALKNADDFHKTLDEYVDQMLLFLNASAAYETKFENLPGHDPRKIFSDYCYFNPVVLDRAARTIPRDKDFSRRLLIVFFAEAVFYFGKASGQRMYQHLAGAVAALKRGEDVDLPQNLTNHLKEMIKEGIPIGFCPLNREHTDPEAKLVEFYMIAAVGPQHANLKNINNGSAALGRVCDKPEVIAITLALEVLRKFLTKHPDCEIIQITQLEVTGFEYDETNDPIFRRAEELQNQFQKALLDQTLISDEIISKMDDYIGYIQHTKPCMYQIDKRFARPTQRQDF